MDDDADILRRIRATIGLSSLVDCIAQHLDRDETTTDIYRRAFRAQYVWLGGDDEEAGQLLAVAERVLRAERGACTCCGGRHGRELHPGEHCDWCDRPTGHPLEPLPTCPLCSTGHGVHNHAPRG